MSPVQLIVNAVLTIALPILIGVVYWFARVNAQRMPEYQAARLEQFARMAARSSVAASGENRKTLATALVATLFTSFRLPVPLPDAVEIAITAALFELEHEM